MDRENGKHLAGGTPKKSRPKKPKKPSRLTRQQKLLIAVAVVLAIVLIAVVACQSLFIRPDLPDKNADADSGTQEEEIDWGEGTRPRSDGERKSEDYYTVLILGRDTGGGGNTDTMLLASYDVTNQKATVMSIPRDTMVNVSWDIKRSSISIRRSPSWWALSRTIRWSWSGRPWARSWTPWAASGSTCPGT